MSQRFCVFCNSSGKNVKITKEHVFPKWLKNVVSQEPGPEPGIRLHSYVYDDNGIKINTSKIKHGLNEFEQTVCNVCIKCNNGWMSNLEGLVKTSLTSLILGDEKGISTNDYQSLVKWAFKTTLMLSTMEKGESNTPSRHFKNAMQHYFPDDVFIFIGQYDIPVGYSTRFIRGNIGAKNSKFYTSSYTIGKLFIHVCYFDDIQIRQYLIQQFLISTIRESLVMGHGDILLFPSSMKKLDSSLFSKQRMSSLSTNLLTNTTTFPPYNGEHGLKLS